RRRPPGGLNSAISARPRESGDPGLRSPDERQRNPGWPRMSLRSCGLLDSRLRGNERRRCCVATPHKPRTPPLPACGESIGGLRPPFLALRTPMRSIGYGAQRAGEGEFPRAAVLERCPSPQPSPRHSASKTRVNALMAGGGGGPRAPRAPPPPAPPRPPLDGGAPKARV